MKQYVRVSLVVLAALSIGGCMGSGGRYIEAVQEAESVMADLERVEAQKSALAQQLKTLKELNAKLMQEGQLAKDELQRIDIPAHGYLFGMGLYEENHDPSQNQSPCHRLWSK